MTYRDEEVLEISTFHRSEYSGDKIQVNREEARLLAAWLHEFANSPETVVASEPEPADESTSAMH
jgi:hypothetical protein